MVIIAIFLYRISLKNSLRVARRIPLQTEPRRSRHDYAYLLYSCFFYLSSFCSEKIGQRSWEYVKYRDRYKNLYTTFIHEWWHLRKKKASSSHREKRLVISTTQLRSRTIGLNQSTYVSWIDETVIDAMKLV